MSLDGKLEIYGVTDVGRKRSHNEDHIGSDRELGVAVLADGMGGYKAGEVASAIAADTIAAFYQRHILIHQGGKVVLAHLHLFFTLGSGFEHFLTSARHDFEDVVLQSVSFRFRFVQLLLSQLFASLFKQRNVLNGLIL